MRKIKTMRDIWDEERKVAKNIERVCGFFKVEETFGEACRMGRHAEEGFAKTQRYFLEHLELKKVVMDFFPDYQQYLGEGGFTKI